MVITCERHGRHVYVKPGSLKVEHRHDGKPCDTEKINRGVLKVTPFDIAYGLS